VPRLKVAVWGCGCGLVLGLVLGLGLGLELGLGLGLGQAQKLRSVRPFSGSPQFRGRRSCLAGSRRPTEFGIYHP